MERERDEGNEPVPGWSSNPVYTRQKPHSASRVQSHNWVPKGIIRIPYVCSIWIWRWCIIGLHGGCLALFSHLQRWFLTLARQQKPKAKTNALRTELVKKGKVDDETYADTWTLSTKQCKINSWPNFFNHRKHVSNKLDADFNFPKIHLMSHFNESLQQYSAKRHEQAHETNLKDGWNASNHNLNYPPQGIAFQHCIPCCEIRELNL